MFSSSSKGKGGGGDRKRKGDKRRDKGSSGSNRDRPPSPGELLEQALASVETLRAEYRRHEENFNNLTRAARRMELSMNMAETDINMLSDSAAHARASRQGESVDALEISR